MPLGLRLTLIVLVCLGAGAGLGWLVGRLLGRGAAWGLALGGLAAMAWLILLGRSAPGMEGLGFVLFAVLFVLPGTVSGVAVAWWVGSAGAARATQPDQPSVTPND